MSELRENKIQRLCGDIISKTATHHVCLNGWYEFSCSYCLNSIRTRSPLVSIPTMGEINHKEECIYLLAKELITN